MSDVSVLFMENYAHPVTEHKCKRSLSAYKYFKVKGGTNTTAVHGCVDWWKIPQWRWWWQGRNWRKRQQQQRR